MIDTVEPIENNIYKGYIELSDVLDIFSQSPFICSEGFVLTVEKNKKETAIINDYRDFKKPKQFEFAKYYKIKFEHLALLNFMLR